MTTVHRITYARAGIVLTAGLTALAAMFLLNPSKGEAAQTYTVTFDAVGGDKGNLQARKGDTVVFKNALPLTPVTGQVVPVNTSFGGETFAVAGTPVARTITESVSYAGTYAVAGLVPLTKSSGTITAADDPPPPPPPPPSPSPPPPDEGPPPDPGNPPTDPGDGTPGDTPGGGTGPNIPPGDPGSVPGNASGPELGSGSISGQTPEGAGQVPVLPPKSDSNTIVVPGASDTGKQRTLSNAGSTAGGLGLTAMLGAVLLLGVGIALARTLISRRLNPAATT